MTAHVLPCPTSLLTYLPTNLVPGNPIHTQMQQHPSAQNIRRTEEVDDADDAGPAYKWHDWLLNGTALCVTVIRSP